MSGWFLVNQYASKPYFKCHSSASTRRIGLTTSGHTGTSTEVESYCFYDMAPQQRKHRQLMLGTKTDGSFKHLANCLYALSITSTSDSLPPFSILAVLLYLSSTREEAWLCFRQSINFPLLRDNFSQHTRGVSTSPSHTCGEDRCLLCMLVLSNLHLSIYTQ